MELKVYWTRFAAQKLEDIYTYYKLRAGLKVAEKLVTDIVLNTLTLTINPEGKQVEELLIDRPQEFRYTVYKNYKIIYIIDEPNSRILISNIFDTRQNPEKIKSTSY